MRIGSRSHILAAGCLTLCLTTLLAQDRAPGRDAARQPDAPGTAVITGTLTTDDPSPRPIRRATINLSGNDVLRTRITVTDDAGRFTFAALPALNFSLWASKPGYVTAYYGGRRPGRGPGVPIALADGQRVSLTLKMLRGAVITGTITDPLGRPAQAQVQILQYQMIGGESVLQSARFVSGISPLGLNTDDRGVYRVYGLPPGDYIVSASVRATPGDLRPTTTADVQWAQQITQPPAAAPGMPAAAVPPAAAQTVGYSSVYFPGTVDPSAASVVSLSAGEERTGINFSLQMVPTARIEGTVVDPDGRRVSAAQLTILPKSVVGDVFLMLPRATVVDGRFVASGISPGTYVVTARGRGAAPGGAPAGGRGGAPPSSLWAMTEIVVAGKDFTGIEMRLEPGIPISGRFAFESATGQPPANVNNYRASLGAWRSGTGPSVSITVPSATVDAEGRFQFASVVPGAYRVSGFGGVVRPDQGPAWMLKSVTANGRDITDLPLEIRPREEPPDLVITFTDRITEVAGTLFDAAGRPSSGLSIIMFPSRRELWTQGSRHIRPTVPASDGKFKLPGLPPGEYYMAAVTEFEYTDLSDASFLEQLTTGAFKITLAEGEKKVQDIRMGGV